MDKYVKGNVEFADGESKLAKELNKKSFTREMLNEKRLLYRSWTYK